MFSLKFSSLIVLNSAFIFVLKCKTSLLELKYNETSAKSSAEERESVLSYSPERTLKAFSLRVKIHRGFFFTFLKSFHPLKGCWQ